jgi:hypothetical protein
LAQLQLNAEKLSPETSGSLGIIGWELDADSRYALHGTQG